MARSRSSSGYFLKSHDSDPSVSSLPPSNPGLDTKLKKHGCRRHATWAAQTVSALEHQSVVVAGTDAAAVVLPHVPRQLIAPRAQRTDIAAQVETLAGGPPSCARS